MKAFFLFLIRSMRAQLKIWYKIEQRVPKKILLTSQLDEGHR
jgi:hypothetical protein